jgi:2'-5' RNA ligase
MAKSIGKYFLAIVPEGDIQEKATELKLLLKENFNLKYALKSPAHVTLKMPFNWNEAKEDKLKGFLREFFEKMKPFLLHYKSFDRFGKRVIFIKVKDEPELTMLQSELSGFCKKGLKLTQELSDNAYHPHMTLAFKDIKATQFATYWDFIKKQQFEAKQEVKDVGLLKRIEGRWVVVGRFSLAGIDFSPP